jgi:hypothetical protein
MFGQEFTLVGGIGVIFTTVAFLLTRPGASVLITKASSERYIAAALLMFWSYVFGMSIFFGSSNAANLLKATAAGFSVPICFLLLSSNGNLIDQTFSMFTRLNSLLGYSVAITLCLIPFVGYNGLHLATYVIAGYDNADSGGNGDILFPFTVVYGKMAEYGIYRFCSIYREAGIAQAFFVWSFVYLMYSRARGIWIIGSLLGALLCGSTAVIFSFGTAALIHFGSRSPHRPRQLFILVLLLGAMVLLLLFVPGIGLVDKAATHGASITDRQDAMALALPGSDIWRWLFGHGLFYDATDKVENAGINAVAAIFDIGAVGFVLYVSTFVAGTFGRRFFIDGYRYLTLISPFLVTSLFFQPVVDAPLVMAVLFFFPPSVRNGPGGPTT